MSKKIFYRYNPTTDNYERVYPSFKKRIWSVARHIVFGLIIGIVIFFLFSKLYLTSPREQLLIEENRTLKAQYDVLQNRLDDAHKIMDILQNRDDNFYRVMMQMDPMSRSQRYSGLDKERNQDYKKFSDVELMTELTQQVSLLERRLYAQSLSFEHLREMADKQKDKVRCIPAIVPVPIKNIKISSGFGYRRDPVYGGTRFHSGIDFSDATGTPIYATADGVVAAATWASGYGNKIDINHGYNYLTRYAHLSKIDVKPGQTVKRGQKIGEMGSTGKSTGPHLHYEVRFKDEPQNPVNYYYLDVTPEQYNSLIESAENAGYVMD